MPVEADFNNDIVGNSRGGNGVVDAETVRVYSEGPEDSMSRSLARYIARMAATYVPSHAVRPDGPRRTGSAAAATTRRSPSAASRRSSSARPTRTSSAARGPDTVDGVDFAYLAQNARVNAAAVASLALAPPAPVVTNERGR